MHVVSDDDHALRRDATTVPGQRLDAVVLFAGFFALYAVHSMMRHFRWQTGGYDLGIFTQAVARYAHFQAPVAEIKAPGANLLGDHFHPILITLAPLYRLFPSPYTLLVVQAVLLAASVSIVYWTARLRLSRTAAAVLAVAYGFSWGIAGAVAFEFHELAFAVPMLALAVNALLRGRFVAAAAWSCGLVLVKEDLPLTTAMFGVLLFLAGARRLGVAVAGFGVAAFGLLVLVVIPGLNAVGEFSYWDRAGVSGGDTGGGGSLADLVLGAFTTPKLFGVLALLVPVAFVALLSRISLLALPTVAWHLVASDPVYSGLEHHYGLILMPIMFLAAADGLPRLQRLAGWAVATRRGTAPRPAGDAQVALARGDVPVVRLDGEASAGRVDPEASAARVDPEASAARVDPEAPAARPGRPGRAVRPGRVVRLVTPVVLGAMVLAGIGYVTVGEYPLMLNRGWWQRPAYASEGAAAIAAVPEGATVAAHNRLAAQMVTDREVHLLDAGLRDAYGRIIDVEYVAAELTHGTFPIDQAQRRELIEDLQSCGYQEIYREGSFVVLRRAVTAPRGAELAACLPPPPGRSPGR